MSDFNIYLSKKDSDHDTFNFSNTMCSNFFIPLVNQSTLVANK